MRSVYSSVSPIVFTGAQHTLMRHAHTRSRATDSEARGRLSQVLQLSPPVLRHWPCCVDSAIPEFRGGQRMGRFILGVIVGAAAVWVYRRALIEYVDDKTRLAPSKAADTLQSAAQTLQGARETIDPRISLVPVEPNPPSPRWLLGS